MCKLQRRGLIADIQRAAISDEPNVAGLLRKARLAASKLNQTDALNWIDRELNGYGQVSWDDLPDYRQGYGILRALNPVRGLIPVEFKDPEQERLATRTPIVDGVGSIQAMLRNKESASDLQYSIPPRLRNRLQEASGHRFELVLLVNETQLTSIIDRVAFLVLEWAAELESRGITGENMAFDENDRAEASQATQMIFAQNIGHLGDASGLSSQRIEIKSYGEQRIDLNKLADVVRQSRDALPLLPDAIKKEASRHLDELEEARDDEERRKLAASLRTVLEAASGSVVAQGIIQSLNLIFS